MIIKAVILTMLFASTCFAGDIQQVQLPIEVTQEMRVTVDEEITGKVWNRWTSENFVVCSLNNEQARYLNLNLEKVKSWIYTRWGIPDLKFASECRLVCVDDKALFKKMFGLEESKVEIRRDSNGKIKLSVIFILLDGKPSHTIPIPLTEVCLSELEQHYNFKLGWWIHRGMSHLNGNLDVIKYEIKKASTDLENNELIYFTKTTFNLSEQDYWKLDKTNRKKFDQSSMILILLLRKEFGQDKLLEFMKRAASGVQAALKDVYKFEYNQIDVLYKNYLISLGKDLNTNKTPDSYLQIKN